MDEVKRCPFCGGEAKLMGGKVYTIPEIDSNGAYVDADIEVEPSPTWPRWCMGASSRVLTRTVIGGRALRNARIAARNTTHR